MPSPEPSLLDRAHAAQDAVRSDHAAAGRQAEAVLAEAGPADTRARAIALLALATIAMRESRHADLIKTCRDAQEAAQAAADGTLVARSLNLLGLGYYALADHQAALENFQKSVQAAESAGDAGSRSMAMANLAMIMHAMGEMAPALEVYRELMSDPQIQAIPQRLAQTRHNFAQISWDLGRDLPECARIFQLAAEGKRAVGDRWSLTLTLCCLAGVQRDLGDFTASKATLDEIATFLTDNASHQLTHLYQLNLGVWYAAAQNPARDLAAARTALEAAVAAAQAGKLADFEARAHEHLADVHMAAQDFADACKALKASAQLLQTTRRDESQRRIERLRVAFDAERALAEARHERRRREEAEAHNRQLEALNREKSDIIGLIAHDLRAPLAGAVELTSDLLATPDDAANVTDTGQALLGVQRQMLELTQSLLDVESLESGHFHAEVRTADLGEVLGEVLRAHAADLEAKQLDARLVLTPPTVSWHGPVLLLERVVENLFSNAVKYSPPGRRIQVAATHSDGLTLRVSDQGPGIPAEKRTRMFEKFATLGSRPTGGESMHGLGLYLAKVCAQTAGGDLRYEDAPGGGASFVLEIPARETPGIIDQGSSVRSEPA